MMRVIISTIIFLSISNMAFSQNIEIKIIAIDAVGRVDSVVVGLSDSSSAGIDTSFNESDLYGIPNDSLDFRVIQRDSSMYGCNPAHGSGEYYAPHNIDSKVDYRPEDWSNSQVFYSFNNHFELQLSALSYPVNFILAGNDGLSQSIYNGYAGIWFYNSFCQNIDIAGFDFLNIGDTIHTVIDSSENQVIIFEHEVGISENNTFNNVRIFPNPAYDWIIIAGSSKEDNIIVVDIIGHRIDLENNKDSNQINVSSLSNGIYFLQVRDETKKFVISR